MTSLRKRFRAWWEGEELPQTPPPRTTTRSYVTKLWEDLTPEGRRIIGSYDQFNLALLRAIAAEKAKDMWLFGKATLEFFGNHLPYIKDGTLIEFLRRIDIVPLDHVCKTWFGMTDNELSRLDPRAKKNVIIVRFVGPHLAAARVAIHGLCALAQEHLEKALVLKASGDYGSAAVELDQGRRLHRDALQLKRTAQEDILDRLENALDIVLTDITSLRVLWNGTGANDQVETQPGCLTPLDSIRKLIDEVEAPRAAPTTKPVSKPVPSAPVGNESIRRSGR